jgi:hypothetical protein
MIFFKRIKKFIRENKHILTIQGLLVSLVAFFTGHLFTSIIVGGMTYIFWKNSEGNDVLVAAR